MVFVRKCTLILVIVSCLVGEATALHQKDEILLYNIGLGGVIGGVGAVVNREEGQAWHSCFLKGFVQGSVGGLIAYQGKSLTYKIGKEERLEYGWLAKIVHSTGASIMENAAMNKNFCESWSLHFGFVRMETTPLQPSVKFRVLPYAMYGFVRASLKGGFDLEKTVKLGTPYFGARRMLNERYAGLTFWNDMIVNENYDGKYQTIAHEYVHVFQFREYLALNGLIQKKMEANRVGRNTMTHFYPDFPYQQIVYQLEGRHEVRWYYRNFLELEAECLSTHREVPIPSW